MQKMEKILGEPVVRKHLTITAGLFAKFQAEAEESHGNNLSLLLKKILTAWYNNKDKK